MSTAAAYPTRRPDWRSRLARYLETVRRAPFAYGASDCACFAAGAIEAMTDVDPMVSLRGRYADAKEAKRLLRDLGAPTLDGFIARSFEEIAAAMAQRGDLAILPADGPFACAVGIIDGERVMAMSEAGLDSRDRSEVLRAFRV